MEGGEQFSSENKTQLLRTPIMSMHSPEDLQKDRNKHTQTERCIVGNII